MNDAEADRPIDRIAQLEQEVAALHARVAQLEHARAPAGAPAPAPRAWPRAEDATAIEARLGSYWLSRIGIVSLISGAALLIITYFGELGALLRVALGYALAAAVAWTGLRLARRHGPFGRVVFGGGLAIGYFVTYALHFVPALQVVESEAAGVALVAAAIAGIVVVAHRMRSETVAGIALFLGLHTGMLSDVTALTLACTTLLAAGAAFFLAANRWVVVPLSTVIAVYSTHATLVLDAGATPVSPSLSLAFLGVDFALFAGAALFPSGVRARPLVALALLDWLGVLVLGAHALRASDPAALFAFLCVLAAAHALLAGIARARRAPGELVAALTALALVTLALALPVRLDGAELLGGWIALALATAYAARRAGAPALDGLALMLLRSPPRATRTTPRSAPARTSPASPRGSPPSGWSRRARAAGRRRPMARETRARTCRRRSSRASRSR